VTHVARRGGLTALVVCLTCAAYAWPAPSAAARPATSSGRMRFRPRVGRGMGLIPSLSSRRSHRNEPSEAGIYTPLTYHGGPTMTGGVTVHTIFWAPGGYAFMGAPPGSQSYEGMIEQYLSDVAAASTGISGAPCLAT